MTPVKQALVLLCLVIRVSIYLHGQKSRRESINLKITEKSHNFSSMSGWFPTTEDSSSGWRLDIISLLAVIGESSMAEHSQAITASWVCVLPRIIPAPQALLKPTRPTRLPSIPASVYGIYNGNEFQQLNYFPNLIHPLDELPAFAFEVWKISRNTRNIRVRTFCELDEQQDRAAASNDIPLKSLVTRHSTLSKPPPHVPARIHSPLNILNIFSFALTIGLIIWALLIKDGVACLALFTISFATSVVGLASKWTPTLMQRTSHAGAVPPGNVVIRTRKGAFIVVKCDETVARELYNGTEECEYLVGTKLYRGLVGLGTVLVMMAVILLGNCSWTMQAAIGISYVVLNGLFWAAALVPKDRIWDLSLYDIEKITPIDAIGAENTQRPHDPEGTASYSRTLWYAIRETGEVGWVYRTGAAPKTKRWDRWLAAAQRNVNAGNRLWEAVRSKDELFIGEETETLGDVEGEKIVLSHPGKETAPANHIPPRESR